MTASEETECLSFLKDLLEAYKNGTITEENTAEGLLHIMGAFDIRNRSEAFNWIRNGVSFFKETNPAKIYIGIE